jgi:hypothetical protein
VIRFWSASGVCWVETTTASHVPRIVAVIVQGDLGLAVGTKPAVFARVTIVGHRLHQLVGKQNRQRHHLGRFVSGVAEHDALIAGALIAALAGGFRDALRDLVGLLGDQLNDLERGVTEGLGRVGVADFLDRLADDFS